MKRKIKLTAWGIENFVFWRTFEWWNGSRRVWIKYLWTILLRYEKFRCWGQGFIHKNSWVRSILLMYNRQTLLTDKLWHHPWTKPYHQSIFFFEFIKSSIIEMPDELSFNSDEFDKWSHLWFQNQHQFSSSYSLNADNFER